MDNTFNREPEDELGEAAFKAFNDYWAINGTPNQQIPISDEAKIAINDFSRNENSVKAIIDQQNFYVIYVSENLKEVFGYTKEDFSKNNMLLFFKSLTVKHLAFPIKMTMWVYNSVKNIPLTEKQHVKITFCGVKAKDKNRKVRTLLIRYLALDYNEDELIRTGIVSIEDISYLIKSDFYWGRLVCGQQGQHKAHFFSDRKSNNGDDIISEREKSVLRLIAQGMDSKEIANELFLSPNTVDNHRKNMIARTGARDTTALLQLCISCGII